MGGDGRELSRCVCVCVCECVCVCVCVCVGGGGDQGFSLTLPIIPLPLAHRPPIPSLSTRPPPLVCSQSADKVTVTRHRASLACRATSILCGCGTAVRLKPKTWPSPFAGVGRQPDLNQRQPGSSGLYLPPYAGMEWQADLNQRSPP